MRHGRRPPALRLHLAVVGGLLAISVALWARVWLLGDPASTISCQCGDPAQYLWLIAWVPWSLGHLHDPFLSQAIYAGQGGSNTLELSDLLPSLAVSPVTLLFGPVAAFNVLVTLVPVVNGWSMFVLCRKVSRFLPAQLLASLLLAFGPYVTHEVPYGHFNIDLLFFPPLALWCCYDLLVDGRHPPARVGVLLGVLCIVQFFTGTEVLAMCAVLVVPAAVAVVLAAPALVRARRRELATGLGVALLVAGAVLAYPLWFSLDGPRHVVGYPWPDAPYYGYSWDSILDQTPAAALANLGGYYGGPGPSPPYLGIGLVGLLGVSVVLWRRRRLAWLAAAVGAVAWLLSLGLHRGSGVGAWTPWRLLYRVPLAESILPMRFCGLYDLAAALLLALTLDVAWQRRSLVVAAAGRRLARWDARHAGAAWGAAWGAACCAGAAGALVPLAAQLQVYAVHEDPVPAWFTAVAPAQPAGRVLLVLPIASSAATQAMAWQVDARFAFAMVGGEAQVPGADGRTSIHIDPPGGAFSLLVQLSWGLGAEPAVTPADAAALRRALAGWGVDEAVVTSQTRYPPYALAVITEALGRAPRYQDGVWVWYGLGGDPPLSLTAAALRRCAAGSRAAPGAAPACVLRAAAAAGP